MFLFVLNLGTWEHVFNRARTSESPFHTLNGRSVKGADEGAEAAAGTSVAISNTVLAPLFIVDHPFIFFIVTEAGAPAFMGHVANPLERL